LDREVVPSGRTVRSHREVWRWLVRQDGCSGQGGRGGFERGGARPSEELELEAFGERSRVG
jgi:hypothetical protein